MARPILTRRQLLGTILVTGAAGGAGLATAGPAFAGPPRGWRLLKEFASPVTADGVINHQSLLGVWDHPDSLTARVYWGVRLHNTDRWSNTVRYSNTRTWTNTTWSNTTSSSDEVRSWVLPADGRKVVWFGGYRSWSFDNYEAQGRTQYGNRAWGRRSSVDAFE